jgi:hypothetical protein
VNILFQIEKIVEATMTSKFISKSVLIFIFSILLNTYVFGQTYDVTVILKDNSTVKGELLEITPDSVAVITEDTGEYLVINGSEISTVYIKGLNKSIKFPISEVPDIFEKDKKEKTAVPYTPGAVNTIGETYIPTTTRSTQFSIGASFGGLSSFTKEALEGFKETEFVGGTSIRGSFLIKFPARFAFGLDIGSYTMDLEENKANLGTLKLTPILLSLQWYKIPYGSGFGTHAGIGLGIVLTSFDKGADIIALEYLYGAQINVETESAFIFELNFGFDYFFTEAISLCMEGKLLLGNVGTSWTASAGSYSVPVEGFDNFFASNFQYLGGLRVWFD